MSLTVVILAALSAGLAVAGAARVFPWTFSLPAGLIAGLWVALAVWRPSSRLHVLPMLFCVGTCAALAAAGDGAHLFGLVSLPLALFAWDASLTRRVMTRFTASVPRSVVLRYAIAVAGISAAATAAAVGANLLPLHLTFPVSLGLAILLLGLAIGVLWIARRSPAVPPNEKGKKEGGDAPEDASPL